MLAPSCTPAPDADEAAPPAPDADEAVPDTDEANAAVVVAALDCLLSRYACSASPNLATATQQNDWACGRVV